MSPAGSPRIVIAGGGTGGHLFPGLAVAEVLRAQGCTVTFVGTANGIEVRAVPNAGFPLELVSGQQVRGGGALRAVRGLGAVIAGVRESLALMTKLDPALVIGVGGYASVSMVVAAWLRRRPTVLLEQNTIPGFASRLLGRIVRRVCLGFPEAARFFPAGRSVHCGNPIRAAVLAAPATPHERVGLLVFGGSQGARRINEAAVDALAQLRTGGRLFDVVHQTGVADHAAVVARYAAAELPARVEPFIADMGSAYAAADVVIARAGAMSCAEITARGLPSILVPYPHAMDDHQRRNAETLVERGAALLLLDHECDGPRLAELLGGLVRDDERLAKMRRAATAIGRPDAANEVARLCLSLANVSAS